MSDGPRVRILGIDPIARGFGFVVLEHPWTLLDWGVKDVRDDKEVTTLAKVRDLVNLYHPSVLVLEDCTAPGSRRGLRIVHLTDVIAEEARKLDLPVAPVSAVQVQRTFAPMGARTKRQMIRVIIAQFPALELWKPPVRKTWMSEDPRTAIFDAAAFALAYLDERRGGAWGDSSARSWVPGSGDSMG